MVDKVKGLLHQIEIATKRFDADEVESVAALMASHLRENIATYPKGFELKLEQAVNGFDRGLAEQLCEKLVNHLRIKRKAYPSGISEVILNTLRRKRYFDLLVKVADVLIQTGQETPKIRRLYAQALLDQGYITAGFEVLRGLESDCLADNNAAELAEVRGLMGRAQKQIYMDSAAIKSTGKSMGETLAQAIRSYDGVYKEHKEKIWQGINVVALLDRARRDKIPIGDKYPQWTEIAKQILKEITQKKDADHWDYATAGEASLALKDYQQSLQWIVKYTEEANTADAFEYASTLRQFEEVWQLDENKQEQAQILHLLRAALLRQEGGQLEIVDPEAKLASAAALETDTQFEQVLGIDRYNTFKWYRTGLDRATGVAQILDRSDRAFGTGFLVRGRDLHPSIGAEWVVITNAHVVSNDVAEQRATPSALPPDEVNVRFEAKDPTKTYTISEILFSSPRSELDCTVFSLNGEVQQVVPFPIAKRLPLLNKNMRIYVIGHPRGGGLSYSIHDNLLLDHEAPKVHYRSPTEGGSSGSPVFNQQWDLIGLHHAGGLNIKRLHGAEGTYSANEGIFIQSIRNGIADRIRTN